MSRLDRGASVASIDEVLAAETPAFGRAVRAIITGNADDLRAELAIAPGLIRARSSSPHHATLLHYVSANGIESELQFAVPNADEIGDNVVRNRKVERHGR
jgi:hypothetical protein